jgi:hypothetical protein
MEIDVKKVILWSDSTIVLSWIKTAPSKFKIFVANRVASIQRKTNDCDWKHVKTDQNPADHLSRGMMPSQIIENQLWWHGPKFLLDPEEKWCKKDPEIDEKVIQETTSQHSVSSEQSAKENEDDAYQYVKKFGTTQKMIRVLAYVNRFFKLIRTKDKLKRYRGPLISDELTCAMNQILKAVQSQRFQVEIKCLKQMASSDGKMIDSRKQAILCKSPIRNLNPFLDSVNLVRVGGRIENSLTSFNSKHPIILPSDHSFTENYC